MVNRVPNFGEVVAVSVEEDPSAAPPSSRCLKSWFCFAIFMMCLTIMLVGVLYWVGAVSTTDLMFFVIVVGLVGIVVILKVRSDYDARARATAASQLASISVVHLPPVKDDPPAYDSLELSSPPPYESLTSISSNATKNTEVSLHI